MNLRRFPRPPRPQDCGPIQHFRQRDARGTLERMDSCERCGRQLQPLSSDEVERMRRGMKLLNRVREPRERPVR